MEIHRKLDAGASLPIVADKAIYGQVQLSNQEPIVPILLQNAPHPTNGLVDLGTVG